MSFISRTVNRGPKEIDTKKKSDKESQKEKKDQTGVIPSPKEIQSETKKQEEKKEEKKDSLFVEFLSDQSQKDKLLNEQYEKLFKEKQKEQKFLQTLEEGIERKIKTVDLQKSNGNWLEMYKVATIALENYDLYTIFSKSVPETLKNIAKSLREAIQTSERRISEGAKTKPTDESCTMVVKTEFRKDSRDCEIAWYSQLAGNEEVRRSLLDLITDPFFYPSLVDSKVLGILLYGPPGTGKTTLAKATANELMQKYKDSDGNQLLQVFFYAPDSSTLKSSSYGGTEKLIASTFSCAQKEAEQWEFTHKGTKAISIIFIDELDDLVPSRDGPQASDKNFSTNAIIRALDGVNDYSKVIFIGATNLPSKVDSAVLSRLTQREYLSLPTEKDVVAILNNKLTKIVRNSLETKKSSDLCVDPKLTQNKYQWNNPIHKQFFTLKEKEEDNKENEDTIEKIASMIAQKSLSNRVIDKIFTDARIQAKQRAQAANRVLQVPNPFDVNSNVYFSIDCLGFDYLMNMSFNNTFVFKDVNDKNDFDIKLTKNNTSEVLRFTNVYWKPIITPSKWVENSWINIDIKYDINDTSLSEKEIEERKKDDELITLIASKLPSTLKVFDTTAGSATLYQKKLFVLIEIPDRIITILEQNEDDTTEEIYNLILNYKILKLKLLQNAIIRVIFQYKIKMQTSGTVTTKNDEQKKKIATTMEKYKLIQKSALKKGENSKFLEEDRFLSLDALLKIEIPSDQLADFSSNVANVQRGEAIYAFYELDVKKATSENGGVFQYFSNLFGKRKDNQTYKEKLQEYQKIEEAIKNAMNFFSNDSNILNDRTTYITLKNDAIVPLKLSSVEFLTSPEPIKRDTLNFFNKNWWEDGDLAKIRLDDNPKINLSDLKSKSRNKKVDYSKTVLFTNWNIKYEDLASAVENSPAGPTEEDLKIYDKFKS